MSVGLFGLPLQYQRGSGGAIMTEAEWLACDDPAAMLGFLANRASDRQLRPLWHLLEPRSQEGVQIAERFADGLASEEERLAAAIAAAEAHRNANSRAQSKSTASYRSGADDGDPYWRTAGNAALGARLVASWIARSVVATNFRGRLPNTRADAWTPLFADAWGHNRQEEQARQCHLLRDVFGNPFRPATFAACLTDTPRSLAAAAYDERNLPSGHLDSDRLAVLSDALEEAGCTDSAILSHLRSPGPHVRGCWAVDLVLGKS
jgi:hypothetical protein